MKVITSWLKSPSTLRLLSHAALVLAMLGAVQFLRSQYGFVYAREIARTALSAIVTEERGRLCPDGSLLSPISRSNGDKPNPVLRGSAIDIAEHALLPGLSTLKATDEEKLRVAQQALKAQRLQCMHADLFARYTGNYYMAVLVSIVCGAVAAVAVAFMGSKGWANANPYVVNVFVTMATTGALFGSLVGIFEQPAMVSTHKKIVLRYEALIDHMASFTSAQLVPSDCVTTNANPCASAADLIRYSDAAFAAQDIPFEMDPSRTAGYGTALSQTTNAR